MVARGTAHHPNSPRTHLDSDRPCVVRVTWRTDACESPPSLLALVARGRSTFHLLWRVFWECRACRLLQGLRLPSVASLLADPPAQWGCRVGAHRPTALPIPGLGRRG